MSSITILPSFIDPDEYEANRIDELALGYIREVNERNRVVTTESILIRQISLAASGGINEALRRVGAKPLGEEMGRLHLLPAFLDACPDEPVLFPRGKWATIQRLQEMIFGSPSASRA